MGARLIVQADDFGMCEAVDAGVVRAFRDGIVTQAMLMVPCPWFPQAAALAKAEGIPVGMHCTLTCEWDHMRWRPLTAGASLVGADGTFHRSVEEALAHVDPDEARVELLAQAEQMLAAGLVPIAFDVHMGMVSEPAYEALCRHHRRPFLYPAFEPHLALDSIEVLSTQPAASKRSWLLDYLDALPPGTHFLQTHPGVPGPELRALARREAANRVWAEAFRASDLEALTDPEVRHMVAARGIELVTAAQAW